MDIPWKTPFFLELDFIYNHWNYFRSSEIFIEDLTPTYIDQNDRKLEFMLGLPGRNNGRYEFGASYIRLNNNYYHDRSDEHTSELQSLMRISYAVFCLTNKKY